MDPDYDLGIALKEAKYDLKLGKTDLYLSRLSKFEKQLDSSSQEEFLNTKNDFFFSANKKFDNYKNAIFKMEHALHRNYNKPDVYSKLTDKIDYLKQKCSSLKAIYR